MNEVQFIPQQPAQSENVIEQSDWPITEAVSDDDRLAFFRLYELTYGAVPEKAEENAQRCVKLFKRMSTGERHVYVMRNAVNEVVAGGEMTFKNQNDRREAYLGHKVVDRRFRGQGLGSRLVEERLQKARESGCEEAYALVAHSNVPALRTITRDGFILKGNGKEKTGFDGSASCYYASFDLHAPALLPPSNDELRRALTIHAVDELNGLPVLINIEDPTLVESVTHQGYVGRWVVTSKDGTGVDKPMIYLESVRQKVTSSVNTLIV